MEVGNIVTRMLAGSIPMKLEITEITEDRIIVGGGWEFNKHTGHEIDDAISVLVSHLVLNKDGTIQTCQ